jgi:hypothetical protein
MQFNSKELIEELIVITETALDKARAFKHLSTEQLNFRPAPGKWSVLECLEHLNRYGDFYLPEIEKRILAQENRTYSQVFKSGVVGNYFAGLMRPNQGQIKKMATPKDKNPLHADLSVTVIDRFIKQQERMISLLRMARTTDLTRTKTAISLTKLIKLRLGDTFRFVIYHVERHLLQAQNVLAAQAVAA